MVYFVTIKNYVLKNPKSLEKYYNIKVRQLNIKKRITVRSQ